MAVVTFRADQSTIAQLDALTRDGESRSDTLRRSIEALQILTERQQMYRRAEELRHDPEDVAEAQSVLAEMAELRAW